MSVKCGDIIKIAEKIAPVSLSESWDNIGLLVGSIHADISKILVALDATDDVVSEALENDANLIITHHPVIFKPISRITDETPLGRRIIRLIENNICVYSLHTNLDNAHGGTNDELARVLELVDVKPLAVDYVPPDTVITGRMGILPEHITLAEFACYVGERLFLDNVRYVGDGDTIIKTVGVFTGSGSGVSNFQTAKAAGCNVFVTGDIRYHEAQEALAMGLCLVDATHYASENIIVDKLVSDISRELEELPESYMELPIVLASKLDGQVFKNSI